MDTGPAEERPDDAVFWSDPATWDDIPDEPEPATEQSKRTKRQAGSFWGGGNGLLPNEGDNVKIPAGDVSGSLA